MYLFLGNIKTQLFWLFQVALLSPVLNEGELELLLKNEKLKPKVLSTYFDIRKGLDGSLDRTVKALCEEADAAVRSGSQLLVLSDRSEEPVSSNVLVCYHSTWKLLYLDFTYVFVCYRNNFFVST
jgi:hypothetical protein